MRLIALLSILLLSCFTTSCNSLLLDERFLDNRLTDWTVVDDPETVEIPSAWRVEADGWLHQRSNIWGRRGDFLGRWYGTFIVAGNREWKDYRFSLNGLPNDDDGFGVVFRFADAEHFYRLIFVNDSLSGGPLTRLDKREGGDYTELWSEQKGYIKGAETFIEIEVVGNRIRAWVDARQLFEVQDDSYKQGEIGLFCYAQSDQAFDNVRVVSD